MTSHGSARWYGWTEERLGAAAGAAAPFEDALQASLAVGKPVVTVGRVDDASLALYAPEKHLITFAPTRSGKGTSLIVPSLLLWSGSCLILDPKGENAYRTAEARRAMGQKVHVLDPFGGVGEYVRGASPETSSVYNPLLGLSLDAPEEIRNLAEALIVTSGERDSHWDNSALDLLEGFILYEVEAARRLDRTPSLVNVRRYVADPAEGAQVARVAQGNDDLPDDNLVREPFLAAGKLARFAAEKPTPEILSIFSTAATQTSFLDNPRIQDTLDAKRRGLKTFNLADLADGKTTIYLVLPSRLLDTFGRWLRLIISRAISDVVKRRPEIPVMFLLDEFGTVGRLGQVARALGLMAGEGIRIWAFLQDLGQLKRHYDEWQTFIANSGVVQFFGTGDYETAKYVSEYLGNETRDIRPAEPTLEYQPLSELWAKHHLPAESHKPPVKYFKSHPQTWTLFEIIETYYFGTRSLTHWSNAGVEGFDKDKGILASGDDWLRDLPNIYLSEFHDFNFFPIGGPPPVERFGPIPPTEAETLALRKRLDDERAALRNDIINTLKAFWAQQKPSSYANLNIRRVSFTSVKDKLSLNAQYSLAITLLESFRHEMRRLWAPVYDKLLDRSHVKEITPQPISRPLLYPDEVIRHPRDVIITFLNGFPSQLRQGRYFEFPEFKGRYRSFTTEAGGTPAA